MKTPTALLIDNLSYQYENTNARNRLQKISENVTLNQGYQYNSSPTNIGYDSNGNMISFADKSISSIQYNFLNLPKEITQDAQITHYTYRADGVKLKKLFDGLETDYLDGFQYKNESNGGVMTLQFFPTAEGYFNVTTGRYYYNYTDHLGNIRLSYSDQGGDGIVTGDIIKNCDNSPPDQPCMPGWIVGDIEEITNYYPFGMMHKNMQLHDFSIPYQYKYNGKELQETGMYDYGARFYMPDIGRWGVVDPLAEVNRAWSPYRYAYNNPIRFIDPDGRLEGDFISEDGTYLGNDGIDDKKVYVVKTTKTSFDSGAPSAGISNKAKKETEKFIEENSGNTEAFKKNNIAYNNSIEIESSATTRQGMVDIVNQDDGKGGTIPANNREYGGRIKKSGEVAEAPPGQITDPINDTKASIILTTYFPEQATFHSHPSGTKVTPDFDGKYKQAPSYKPGDIQNSNNTREYVFGRRDGTVYIFNNKGVQATMPQKYFVNPNKKK